MKHENRIKASVVLVLLAFLCWAASTAADHGTANLPEDRGTAGILAALQKLPVYARVLYVTAHPDDESGGTITWLARGFHARVALFSLTRGDGGQNILGSEKYEALGLIRTGELLEACKIYGAELYFGTAYEFGFSKSAEETLSKWGREASLEELVRFIRWYRPTVIISAFRSDSSGGHGHHQAEGILAAEAWKASGDPQRFPEHAKSGLAPWQPKKFYVRGGFGGAAGAGSVRVPVGDYDPVLGRSYREIGAEGYSKHRSQGNGASYAAPGLSYDTYQLAASAVEHKPQESTLFDSIDTSLASITKLVDGSALPDLDEDLAAVQKSAREALEQFAPRHPEKSAPAVAKGITILAGALQKLEVLSMPGASKVVLRDALQQKLEDHQLALTAVLGIYSAARIAASLVTPGERIDVSVQFMNRGSETVILEGVRMHAPAGWKISPTEEKAGKSMRPGEESAARFTVELPGDAQATEPFWYRQDANAARYKTRPVSNVFAPFAEPDLAAEFVYGYRGNHIPIRVRAAALLRDPLRGAELSEMQVVPRLSISLEPGLAVVPLSKDPQTREFRATVTNSGSRATSGSLRIHAPGGWRIEPEQTLFKLSRKGETVSARFLVRVPAGIAAGTYSLQAVATAEGAEFHKGYQVISYPGNWTRNLYSPASSEVKIFDLRIAPQLNVGYVVGAGDEMPEALAQLGVRVQLLGDTELESGNLNSFNVIVTGIRAYNVNGSLRANSRRLLDYVDHGGTLIVQYNRPLEGMGSRGGGAEYPYGPYPMSNSDADRITVEESPVQILDPQHPIFNTPNKITASDFAGWIQERGLYFMTRWDPHYTALLSGNDPGETPKDGGMLVTRYGKGYYIYTAYAWFRQLPAGVPGAFRIFANMLSLDQH